MLFPGLFLLYFIRTYLESIDKDLLAYPQVGLFLSQRCYEQGLLLLKFLPILILRFSRSTLDHGLMSKDGKWSLPSVLSSKFDRSKR